MKREDETDGVEADWDRRIAALAAVGIALHGALAWSGASGRWAASPLFAVLAFGGAPLSFRILQRLRQGDLGADALAGLSIVVSAGMGEHLVASILVLMLAGGGALERYATRRAAGALEALARRMPRTAHKKVGSTLQDIDAAAVRPGDALVVLPHELCPVDGVVVEGRGSMDEAYLTGEPFRVSKTPGSAVLSGAVNGDAALTIEATALASDSRYARIMRVMEETESRRPALRRLGDTLAAWYIPVTLAVAGGAWFFSGDATRGLSVLVVATPCPLLIAIPVAVTGAISLAARQGIVIRRSFALETVSRCRTIILDKTGTLTYGRPELTEILPLGEFSVEQVLRLAAGLESYSRHPLAAAVLERAHADGVTPAAVERISEAPGAGLTASTEGKTVKITGRKQLPESDRARLPADAAGLECVVLIEGAPAALFRFHDGPRPESRAFLEHLSPFHGVERVLLVTGDREAEARYLAEAVGITKIHAGCSPEEKVAIVRLETKEAPTLFVGDGINDAPALAAATVGVAIGQNSDVTTQAADAVIMTPSIVKLDEFIHIGARMRSVALQSAVGGMALSLIGMWLAATGRMTPLQGAVMQEIIDLAAVLNALRASFAPQRLSDLP